MYGEPPPQPPSSSGPANQPPRRSSVGPIAVAMLIVIVFIAVVVVVLDNNDSSSNRAIATAGTSTTIDAAGAPGGASQDPGTEDPAATTPTTSVDSGSHQPQGTPAALHGPAPGATISGDTPCPKADGSSPRTSTFAKAPPMCIDASKTYTATFSTTKGSFTVALDAVKAPKTVNNFVVLSRYHFYDGIAFHRIIADFMIQGGDPSDPPTGAGGPGYAFADELPNNGEYQIGSIAMANSGPDTNGSQFFIITGPNGVSLPPSYSLFGKVTSGLDTVAAIGKVPGVQSDANDGAPTEAVVITSITIAER